MKHLVVVGTCIIYLLCLSSKAAARTQLGCYQDGVPTIFQTTRKILQLPVNSPDFCTVFCTLANYPIFGLKNGKECWCSMSLEPIQSYDGLVDTCNTPCTGDATKMCGGTDAINIYHTETLTVPTCSNGASSGNCVTVCSSGYECLYPLGNGPNDLGICCPVADVITVVSSDVTTPVYSDVTSPVSSDVTTPVSLDVTTPVSLDVTTPMSLDVTTPVSPDVTTPMSPKVTTPVSSDVTTPVSSDVTTPVSSDVTTPVSPDVTTPVSSDLTTAVPSIYPTQEYFNGYTHLGCYGDGIHNIISTKRKKLNQQQNTPDSCHDYCLMAKYAFFALKKGTQCWCIMNLALTTYPLSAGSCDSPCSGDSSLVCGGGSALDIYQSQSSKVSRCQYGGPSGHCGVAVRRQCSPGYKCNTDARGQAGVCCPTPPFWYQGCFSSGDMLKNSIEMNGYYTHQTCYNFCKPQGYSYFGLRGYSCYCGSDTSLLGTSTGAGEVVCNYQTTTFSVYEIPTAGCPSRDSLPSAFSQDSCTVGSRCSPGAEVKQTCCPTWAGGSVCWPPVAVIQMPNQCDAKYPVLQNHMFASVDPLEMRRCDSTGNCIMDASTQLTLRGQSGIFTSTVASMGLKWALTVTEATYVAEFEVLRMCTSVRGVDRVIIEYSTPTGDLNQMQMLIFDSTLTTEVCSSRPFGVVDWVKFVYDAAEQNTVNNSPIEISSTSLEYCVKTLAAAIS